MSTFSIIAFIVAILQFIMSYEQLKDNQDTVLKTILIFSTLAIAVMKM